MTNQRKRNCRGKKFSGMVYISFFQQAGTKDFTVVGNVIIPESGFIHLGIEPVDNLLGQYGKILLLLVDHLAFQGQGQLQNAGHRYCIGIHQSQTQILNFVGISSGGSAAVSKDTAVNFFHGNVDGEFSVLFQ